MEIALIIVSAAFVAAAAALFLTMRRVNVLEKKASVQLDIDKMTGLMNRDGFLKNGDAVLERAKQSGDAELALIVFDVEQLGKINTLFGTETGDSVVRSFARALCRTASEGDITGRVNTDDFAILTRCADEKDAQAVAEKFGKLLEGEIVSDALRDQVNFFAGVCFFDLHDDIRTMYNKANLCLIMPDEGSRITFFSREMENRMVENEILRTEMNTALNEGQFELYYQPKISFKTGEMRGVEALIRWHHPTMGFVSPDKFIPLAEKTGIITRIDEWGLMTACRQCKQWQDEGLTPLRISVNMSQAQFYRTDVFSTIKRVLAETGLDPKYLEIEVTETMAMQDIERTIGVLGKIRGLGVSISMDDFGSGYSSLSSLKMIPLDILKIDRSLVCDIDENEVSKQITGAIVDLGKAMSLVVLAEGVETKGQCEYLTKIGCDLAQGYYYSKPRPASEIESMLIMPPHMVPQT